MQGHGYRVPSQAEDEPWTCPLCLSSTAPTALLLSQRDASTRRARHPVVSHTACRAGDEGPPRKKRKHVKRDGALLQPAPLQPAPTRLRRPKGWAVQLLTSLEMQAWPTEAELGPLPTRLPSAFTLASDSASGSGWCVLAPTADYFSRFGVPSDEHAQATRLLNNAIKATHLLNTAGLDGPRFHRPPGRTGLGKAKPFYRLSPAALLVLSSSAAKIRRAAESQQQLSVLQIAKKHARLAARRRRTSLVQALITAQCARCQSSASTTHGTTRNARPLRPRCQAPASPRLRAAAASQRSSGVLASTRLIPGESSREFDPRKRAAPVQ